jgi:hypothetical protein
VPGMRHQLPHDRAVLPEIADPVSVGGVDRHYRDNERRECGESPSMQCASRSTSHTAIPSCHKE